MHVTHYSHFFQLILKTTKVTHLFSQKPTFLTFLTYLADLHKNYLKNLNFPVKISPAALLCSTNQQLSYEGWTFQLLLQVWYRFEVFLPLKLKGILLKNS